MFGRLAGYGAAGVFDPVVTIRERDPRMRPRNPQVRGQIDIDMDVVPRPPEDDRFARLIEDLLDVPITVEYAHAAPSGCSP